VHNDDINNILILNKKAMGSMEGQLFAAELEKFKPHQQRLLQATHKQSALMKDLTGAYGQLLQDKRVRSEQSKYEKISRSRNSVMSAFKKVYRAFLDVTAGLEKAKNFYTEMKNTVDSLDKNVDVFVNNRRQEGAALLSKIENQKGSGSAAEREQQRLKDLMERMSVGGSTPQNAGKRPPPLSGFNIPNAGMAQSPPSTPRYGSGFSSLGGLQSPTPIAAQSANYYNQPNQNYPPNNGQYPNSGQQYNNQRRDSYSQIPQPPRRESFAQNYPNQQQQQPYQQQPPPQGQYGQSYQPYNPGAYVPPPPPGPPPPQRQPSFNQYGQPQQQQQQQQQPPPQAYPPGSAYGKPQQNPDPWAGLQSWK